MHLINKDMGGIFVSNKVFISDTLNNASKEFLNEHFKIYPFSLEEIKVLKDTTTIYSLIENHEVIDKLNEMLDLDLEVQTEPQDIDIGDKVIVYKNIDNEDKFIIMELIKIK